MIETLKKIALKLNRILFLIKILGFSFLVMFCFALFELAGIKGETYLIPGLLGLLWSGLVYFLIITFPDIPARQSTKASLLIRIKTSLIRTTYYFAGLIFLVLTAVITSLSIKILRVWLS